MEVRFTPELEKKLEDLAAQTGRPTDKLVQDVMSSYVDGLTCVGRELDSRYDDLKSGRVKAVDGESFFETLRQLEDKLLKKPSRK